MRTLIGLVITLFSISAYAQKSDSEWNWYYAAFYSPTVGSNVMLRSGTARVKLSQSDVSLQFTEREYPEMQASFTGRIVGVGNIKGMLKGFFPSGVDSFSGIYRQVGEAKYCRWQEIILRPNAPDGSVLVLSRIDGPCQ